MAIVSQLKRLYDDRGQNDRDFTRDEERLKKATAHLREASDHLSQVSQIMKDMLLERQR